jgi:hypothetical protein
MNGGDSHVWGVAPFVTQQGSTLRRFSKGAAAARLTVHGWLQEAWKRGLLPARGEG